MNLKHLLEKIESDARQFDRDSQMINLIAASKTRKPEEILAVFEQGQKHFGENYVQEAIEKIQALAKHPLIWHFIGSIQSNKTAEIAKNFSWVHTIDREKIAQRLNQQRPKHLPPLNVCIEVNISQEDSKSGISLTELPGLAEKISAMPRLRLRGLMALPSPCSDFEEQREPFKILANALKNLQQDGFDVDTLSMGTTADYRAAIAEGATMIRLGTAIFGPRLHKPTA